MTKKTRKSPEQKPNSRTRKGLERLIAGFETKIKKVTETIAQLSQGIQLVYNNQVELTKSHDRLEEQFAVLGRTNFSKVNELIEAHNFSAKDGTEVEKLTEEYVTEMFKQWQEFRSRSDFREHFHTWFMGKDLSTLPPPPEPEKKDDDADDPKFKDAVVFGGDYAESEDGNETAQEGEQGSNPSNSEDPMPGVQASDEGETESRETVN